MEKIAIRSLGLFERFMPEQCRIRAVADGSFSSRTISTGEVGGKSR
jgi:hypothetical protein